MNTRWIPTHETYRSIVAAPNMPEKERLFRQGFGPLFEAMRQTAPHIPVQDDVLDSARAWGLLLPEHLVEVPEALRRLETADAWNVAARALREGANRFTPYAHRLTISDVAGWLLLTDPAKAEPSNKGYTGFQFPGGVVSIFDTPNDYNLSRLPGLVVHELHHIVRLSLFPWTFQQPYGVADYIVLEGMAESFAAQLYGEQVVGYYVTDIHEDDLTTAKRVVRDGLDASGDIRGYIFGDHLAERSGFAKIGMPPFGGYAVGYHVMQAFLRRTGQTVEEATFVPAAEIVAESGYFA
jgi:uncharacterized protein YjaZ